MLHIQQGNLTNNCAEELLPFGVQGWELKVVRGDMFRTKGISSWGCKGAGKAIMRLVWESYLNKHGTCKGLGGLHFGCFRVASGAPLFLAGAAVQCPI